jgi:DNA ligase D
MIETEYEGVRLTNPDKVLYPEQGVTKVELAKHYAAAADRMLPHVAGRPVTLVRCPTGRQKNCFYQRHAGSGVPRQLRKVTVPGFDDPYLYIADLPGLVAMVQIGVLEIHPWGVTVAEPTRPDRIVFDLDPGEGLGFIAIVRAALDVRERLTALGLESFVKTTGGKGLHVVVPVDAVHEGRGQAFRQGVVGADRRRRPRQVPDQDFEDGKNWMRGSSRLLSTCARRPFGLPPPTIRGRL